MTIKELSQSQDIWIVIPSYNEAITIEAVLNNLLLTGANIVVVDDCSSDNTESIISNKAVHFIRHPVNLGQGAALQTGFTYALQQGAKYVVSFDADGQHQVEDLSAILEPLIKDTYDVSLGSRFLSGTVSLPIPKSRHILLKLAIFYTRLCTGLNITDTHNGLRAFRAEVLKKLEITQNRMTHASEIISLIAEHKLAFKEVPVSIKYTDYSIKKGQRASNIINILWESFFGAIRK